MPRPGLWQARESFHGSWVHVNRGSPVELSKGEYRTRRGPACRGGGQVKGKRRVNDRKRIGLHAMIC